MFARSWINLNPSGLPRWSLVVSIQAGATTRKGCSVFGRIFWHGSSCLGFGFASVAFLVSQSEANENIDQFKSVFETVGRIGATATENVNVNARFNDESQQVEGIHRFLSAETI